jgi:hypothetical protein
MGMRETLLVLRDYVFLEARYEIRDARLGILYDIPSRSSPNIPSRLTLVTRLVVSASRSPFHMDEDRMLIPRCRQQRRQPREPLCAGVVWG